MNMPEELQQHPQSQTINKDDSHTSRNTHAHEGGFDPPRSSLGQYSEHNAEYLHYNAHGESEHVTSHAYSDGDGHIMTQNQDNTLLYNNGNNNNNSNNINDIHLNTSQNNSSHGQFDHSQVQPDHPNNSHGQQFDQWSNNASSSSHHTLQQYTYNNTSSSNSGSAQHRQTGQNPVAGVNGSKPPMHPNHHGNTANSSNTHRMGGSNAPPSTYANTNTNTSTSSTGGASGNTGAPTSSPYHQQSGLTSTSTSSSSSSNNQQPTSGGSAVSVGDSGAKNSHKKPSGLPPLSFVSAMKKPLSQQPFVLSAVQADKVYMYVCMCTYALRLVLFLP